MDFAATTATIIIKSNASGNVTLAVCSRESDPFFMTIPPFPSRKKSAPLRFLARQRQPDSLASAQQRAHRVSRIEGRHGGRVGCELNWFRFDRSGRRNAVV